MAFPLDDNFSGSLRENATRLASPRLTPIAWDARIRWAFLIFCAACGAVLAYTTRYFVNGDAITYFDMADAFGRGLWGELVNLHYSPGYAVLLGIVIKIVGGAPVNELFAAKVANLLCYAFALLALETLLGQIQSDEEFSTSNRFQRIPWIFFRAGAYGLFLVFSLVYVRIQVISPDMLVFCFTLLAAAVLVWIKRSAESYLKFLVLGLVTGLGYLCKALFFPITAVFLVLSAAYCASVRKALPRVLVAAIVFLIVGAPLFLAISMRLGRFSFGESGNYNYSYFVSKNGSPVNVPERIWNSPRVDVYSYESVVATYPSGFDLSYWNEGVKPEFDLHAQVAVLLKNLVKLIDFSPWLYLSFLVWLGYQACVGASFSARLRPPNLWILFGIIAASGIGPFCLVFLEARYIAPFVFLGFVALLLWPKYRRDSHKGLKAAKAGWIIITGVTVVMVIGGAWDQSVRTLYDTSTKQSHRRTWLEDVAVKDFLNDQGVSRGHLVAIAGVPAKGMYWARLSGVKAIASIPDQRQYLAISPKERHQAENALRSRGIKAIVSTDKLYAGLQQEGWRQVPGTRNFFVHFLDERP